MTIREFQDDFKKELEALFENFKITGTNGQPANLKVYKNDVPLLSANSEEQTAPYLIIRLDSGKHHEENRIGTQEVKILILVCVFNDDENYVGSDDVLIIIQRIIERFAVNPKMEKYYRIGEIDWTVGDTETYPYFFGGVELSFAIPSYTREDDFC